jgi:hypothetical protein
MQPRIVRLLSAAIMTTAFFAAGATDRADQPPTVEHPHYLFIAPTNHGSGQFVPAQSYAYGWFGVCSKPHAVFHWDYYDHRWIWW